MSKGLVAARCVSCAADVLYASSKQGAPGRVMCPLCAEREAGLIELSTALRVRLLSRHLRQVGARVDERNARRQVREVADELREVAALLIERHPKEDDSR